MRIVPTFVAGLTAFSLQSAQANDQITEIRNSQTMVVNGREVTRGCSIKVDANQVGAQVENCLSYTVDTKDNHYQGQTCKIDGKESTRRDSSVLEGPSFDAKKEAQDAMRWSLSGYEVGGMVIPGHYYEPVTRVDKSWGGATNFQVSDEEEIARLCDATPVPIFWLFDGTQWGTNLKPSETIVPEIAANIVDSRLRQFETELTEGLKAQGKCEGQLEASSFLFEGGGAFTLERNKSYDGGSWSTSFETTNDRIEFNSASGNLSIGCR